MTLKVILLGDLGVGKTCLRGQFVHQVFLPAYQATVGGDYLSATADGVRLHVWDTAGQERFNALTQAFYRGADCCVLVYDVTRYELVLSLRDWFARVVLVGLGAPPPPVVVVGNKADLGAERCVDSSELRDIWGSDRLALAVGDWSADVFEVLSKSHADVARVFARVAQVANDRPRAPAADSKPVDIARGGPQPSRCAC